MICHNPHPLSTLLQLLKLDKHYTSGNGDYLYYQENKGEKLTKVLDISGSYGVNLLGYNNEAIASIKKDDSNHVPNFIQLSNLPERAKLESYLKEGLQIHTQKAHWYCEFANSGSEIIEMAIKIVWHDLQKRKEKIKQEIYACLHHLTSSNNAILEKNNKALSKIEKAGQYAFIEGAFHGKTLGALSLIGNEAIKKMFPLALPSISIPREGFCVQTFVEAYEIKYYCFDERKGSILEKCFLPLAGIFTEPIQGEAGVIPLSTNLLSLLQAIQKQYHIPIISDEVQCGLYRTGSFSALDPKHLKADIYCFGKQLGAGIAKIATLCCQENIYAKELAEINTSTFAADSFSFKAGIAFFQQIHTSTLALQQMQENNLLQSLQNLQIAYPQFISSISGDGHMIAIHLNEKMIYNSYLTKFFKDIDKLGYWIASVLLNRTALRVFPTLSAPLTFRCQPSLNFSVDCIEWMINAWKQFFNAILSKDIRYLFGHIIPIPEESTQALHPFPSTLKNTNIPEGAAVFLCHPIHAKHAGKIVDLIHFLGDAAVEELLQSIAYLQEFTIYHQDILYDKHQHAIDVVFLGIPMTSHCFYKEIRNGDKHVWIQKIQKAVNYANHYKARVIGLGQFTSIITKNGNLLHSPHSLITTGNAYTAHLCIEAVRMQIKEQKKNIQNLSVCIIGAKGNIMAVTASILAKEAQQIVLVYRSPLQFGNDTYLAVKQLIQSLLTSSSTHQIVNELKNKYNALPDPTDWMKLISTMQEYIIITHSIHHPAIGKADIIFIGTNDTQILLKESHIKKGTIVADVSVPTNTDISIQKNPAYVFIKGGIAGLPIIHQQLQTMHSIIFPFDAGECYACMAETFGIGFTSSWSEHNVGNITEEKLINTAKMLSDSGFYLMRSKTENSI